MSERAGPSWGRPVAVIAAVMGLAVLAGNTLLPEERTTPHSELGEPADFSNTGLEAADACIQPEGEPSARCQQVAGYLLEQVGAAEEYAAVGRTADLSAQLASFQNAAGLRETGHLDAPTMYSLVQETERLDNPPLPCTADPDQQPWSRRTLVDHLAQMQAFGVTYGNFTAPRRDLLDPSLSSDALVEQLASLTHYAECNDLGFNVLIVNTGHARNTLSRNVSQHVLGDAVDIRPMNADGTPMSAVCLPQADQEPANECLITSHPEAYDTALQLMEHIQQRPADFYQVIWTDGPFAINHGRLEGADYSFGEAVDQTHHDHIHLGINP